MATGVGVPETPDLGSQVARGSVFILMKIVLLLLPVSLPCQVLGLPMMLILYACLPTLLPDPAMAGAMLAIDTDSMNTVSRVNERIVLFIFSFTSKVEIFAVLVGMEGGILMFRKWHKDVP